MVTKRARQAMILDLVRQQAISSQDRLASRLASRGVRVTQSTLSRDVRDLGLVKVRGRYQASSEPNGAPPAEDLRRTFRQTVLETGLSDNILMLRTSPGHAHSLGVVLDAARWPEVMGTVAGDDTVFVLLRRRDLGRKLLARVERLLA